MSNGFLPTDISGCKLWLRADGISGLSDDDPVSTWGDESGNDNDATQSNGDRKPLYKTGIINGKPVVRFDGTNDSLVGAISGIGGNSSKTLFLVVNAHSIPTETGAGVFTLGEMNDGEAFGYTIWPRATGTKNIAYQCGTPDWDLDGDDAQTGARLLTILKNGDSMSLRRDRQLQAGPEQKSAADVTVSDYSLGSYHDTTPYFDGDIAEVIVYDSALSAQDIQTVEDYLWNKYMVEPSSSSSSTSSSSTSSSSTSSTSSSSTSSTSSSSTSSSSSSTSSSSSSTSSSSSHSSSSNSSSSSSHSSAASSSSSSTSSSHSSSSSSTSSSSQSSSSTSSSSSSTSTSSSSGISSSSASTSSSSSISLLKLWFDADDADTLFKDAALTQPVTADGDPVGGWKDKSGGDHHATTSDSTARPIYKTGVQNNLPVVRFDGINDVLAGTVPGCGGNSSKTLFAVVRLTGNWQSPFALGENQTSKAFALNTELDDVLRLRGTQVNNDLESGPRQWCVKLITLVKDTNTLSLYENGVQVAAAALSAANVESEEFVLGAFPGLSTMFLNGDICELQLYGDAFLDFLREYVENNLMIKWGLLQPSSSSASSSSHGSSSSSSTSSSSSSTSSSCSSTSSSSSSTSSSSTSSSSTSSSSSSTSSSSSVEIIIEGPDNICVGFPTLYTASGGTPPYSWESSDEDIATVDENTGEVTGVVEGDGGDVTITATDSSGNSGEMRMAAAEAAAAAPPGGNTGSKSIFAQVPKNIDYKRDGQVANDGTRGSFTYKVLDQNTNEIHKAGLTCHEDVTGQKVYVFDAKTKAFIVSFTVGDIHNDLVPATDAQGQFQDSPIGMPVAGLRSVMNGCPPNVDSIEVMTRRENAAYSVKIDDVYKPIGSFIQLIIQTVTGRGTNMSFGFKSAIQGKK